MAESVPHDNPVDIARRWVREHPLVVGRCTILAVTVALVAFGGPWLGLLLLVTCACLGVYFRSHFVVMIPVGVDSEEPPAAPPLPPLLSVELVGIGLLIGGVALIWPHWLFLAVVVGLSLWLAPAVNEVPLRGWAPWRERFALWSSVALAAVVSAAIAPANSKAPRTGAGTEMSESTRAVGLTADELNLASATVKVYWRDSGILWDDEGGEIGSAGVIIRTDGKLQLVTNSHCLALWQIAARRWKSPLAVYQIEVTFPSGQKRKVLRFADQAGPLDLGMLEVDAAGLVEGRDYVRLPFVRNARPSVGELAVAVGSPMGLENTRTFGRISALRNDVLGHKCRYIQTDTAVNPGNSGGPLFVERNGRYLWVGLNTLGMGGAQGLNFAVLADEVFDNGYYWYDASTAGANQALRQLYRQ